MIIPNFDVVNLKSQRKFYKLIIKQTYLVKTINNIHNINSLIKQSNLVTEWEGCSYY